MTVDNKIKLISQEIKKITEEYKTNEKLIHALIDSKGIEYAFYNERPWAAFVSSGLVSALETNSILEAHSQELPIKGVDEDTIKKIKNDFLKSSGFSHKKIDKKQYSSYNIDSFFHTTNDDVSFFVEYKVNKKFQMIDLAIDFLKFLIYTSSNESSNDIFVYVVGYKGPTTLEPISDDFFEITSEKITSVDKDKNIYIYRNNTLSSGSNSDYIKMAAELELFKNISDGSTSMETDKYDQYKNSKVINNLEIYGRNVATSNKMAANSKKIIELRDKMKKAWQFEGNAIDDEKLILIKITMSKLKTTKLAKDKATDDTHYVNHKATNWLLSFITAGAKKFGIDLEDSYFEIRDIRYDGKIINSKGNVGKKFKSMIEASTKIIEEDNQFSKEDVYRVVMHISDYYNLTHEFPEEETDKNHVRMPKLNPDYNAFIKLKETEKIYKKLYKDIFDEEFNYERFNETQDKNDQIGLKVMKKLLK